MGQFKLLALEADWDELAELLRKKSSAVFLEEDASNGMQIREDLRIDRMGVSNLKIFVSSEPFLSGIKLRVSGQNKPVVDSLRSEVIEVSRCYFDDKLLRAGRFYFDSGYYDDHGKRKEKFEEFLKWAANVFRSVKRAFPLDKKSKAYVGPRAAEWIARPGSHVELN